MYHCSENVLVHARAYIPTHRHYIRYTNARQESRDARMEANVARNYRITRPAVYSGEFRLLFGRDLCRVAGRSYRSPGRAWHRDDSDPTRLARRAVDYNRRYDILENLVLENLDFHPRIPAKWTTIEPTENALGKGSESPGSNEEGSPDLPGGHFNARARVTRESCCWVR